MHAYMRQNGGSISEELLVPLILEPFMSGLKMIHSMGLIHRDIKVGQKLAEKEGGGEGAEQVCFGGERAWHAAARITDVEELCPCSAGVPALPVLVHQSVTLDPS